MRFVKPIAITLCALIAAGGGLVQIVNFFGIKEAKDVKMPVAPMPHWWGLLFGVVLFLFSVFLSGYYLRQALLVNRDLSHRLKAREVEWEQRAALLIKQGEEKIALANEAHQKEIDSLKRSQESQQRPCKLIIHSSDYAAIRGGGKTYDVTEFMRQIIAGDSLVLDIENHHFVIDGKNFVPDDPLPFEKKRLRVTYSYDGEPSVTIERKEGCRLVLPEDTCVQDELAKIQNRSNISSVPKIEDDPDVNALNIRITNDIDKTGLQDCFLYLHRRVLLREKARTPLPSFQVMRLTSNHHNIPYREERRYQLLEFTNPAQPFFRGYGETVDLPCMGVWRLDLELVWYGGRPYQFSKCFVWESGKSPCFVDCYENKTNQHEQYHDAVIGELADDDPRIYVEIRDNRQPGTVIPPSQAKIVLLLVNRGKTEAKGIRVDAFTLGKYEVAFDNLPSAIAPAHGETATPTLGMDVGVLWRRDLTRPFIEKWDDLKIEEITVPLRVTYRDFNDNVIETTCELVFSPYEHSLILTGGISGKSSLSTRNFKFRRISAAIEQ